MFVIYYSSEKKNLILYFASSNLNYGCEGSNLYFSEAQKESENLPNKSITVLFSESRFA
jgi:hypothetical protein